MATLSPTTALAQLTVLNHQAKVLYDDQACIGRLFGCVVVHHADLQPQRLGTNGDGVCSDGWDVFRVAKTVHHVDAFVLRRFGE